MGSWVGEMAVQRALDIGTASVSKTAFEEERFRLEGAYSNEGLSLKELIYELKQLMWNKVGVIRNKSGLQEALDQLRESYPRITVSSPKDLIRLLEFQNMRCVAKLVCRAALERTESRGSHFRADFPEEDNRNWIKNVVLRRTNEGTVLEETPVSRRMAGRS
jgi:succinate dehydrogenase/fumarate reductase flavoprotein subunit